jgi:hypothetical protein
MFNIKNMSQFSSHITETVKTAIKAKNNEIVFKMLESLGDKSDWSEEFLKVKFS